MRNRIKTFANWASGWIVSNIAWDVIKWTVSLLFGSVIAIRLPEWIMSRITVVLGSVGLSTLNYAIVFILISASIFGILSLISPPISWIKTYILRSDKPHLIQDNEWNVIINFEGENVGVAMISIANKPTRNTDNSMVYNLSASFDFYDRKDNHILRVKCGYWTRTSPEEFFANSGKKKKCEKIDFYPNEAWYLPVVYKWEDSDMVFAYDPASSIKSKKLGKLPIKFSVTFEGENLKPTRPIKYLLRTQPPGLPGEFWTQKR